jgi:hypothetical protein
MSSKIKLLETAYKKASEDRKFLAYVLEKYNETENSTKESLAILLNSSIETYYKLGLCLTPSITAGSYLAELTKICDYLEVPVMPLNQVIKRVDSVIKFSEDELKGDSLLMAARDKNKKK